MVLDAKFRSHLVRSRLLEADVRAYMAWYTPRREALDDELPLHLLLRAIEELTPAERKVYDQLLIVIPGVEVIGELHEAITVIGEASRMLLAEDRGHLAIARGFLIDALEHLREGRLDNAYGLVQEAYGKLRFITHKRKRNSTGSSMNRGIKSRESYDTLVEWQTRLEMTIMRLREAWTTSERTGS